MQGLHSNSTITRLLLLIAFAAVFHDSVAQRPAEIQPPFGLQWGENSERIEKLLTGAKASIVEQREINGQDAWTVEGLVHEGLRRTVFYFRNDKLVEVELQYQSDSWDTAKYEDRMQRIRRLMDQRFGPGRLIARSKVPEEGVMQTVVGYKWTQDNRAVQLFYYAAEHASEIFRTVSVHYKMQ